MGTATNPASTQTETGFRVSFTLHLRCSDGQTRFEREEHLPFAPFVGLDILDDSLGQFTISQVGWLSERQLFLCHSNVDHCLWSLDDAVREIARSGWTEEEDAREPLDED